jgi:hypothetical protein
MIVSEGIFMPRWIRHKQWKKKLSNPHAQGLVEFAVILPILLIALFSIIELGRLFHAYLAVENGARFGIRYAVTGEYDPANCASGATTEGKCNNLGDEVAARVASIHDVAWAGSESILREGEGVVDNTQPGFFHVLVCRPANLIAPSSTFDTYSCLPSDGAGDPGNHIGKLAAPLSSATITVDSTSSGRFSGDASLSHTTGTGESRLMLVGISVSEASNPPSISATYGGQNLSFAGSTFLDDSGSGVYIYYLINPPSGTHTVHIDYSSSPDWGSVVGVMTFSGVDQNTPLGSFAGATGDSTTPSVNVSSAVGELVFDTFMEDWGPRSAGAGSNQTQRWMNNDGGNDWAGGGSTESGAGSVTMSWSLNYHSPWAIGAVSIKPAEEPTPTPTPSNTPTPLDTPTATPSQTPTSTGTPTNTPIPPTATTIPTNTPIPTALPSGEDPGEPGERIVVVTEFNHQLITPFLSSIWPQLRLTSMREAIVETYYIPPAVGSPPPYSSPTPRPTNTPGPTPTYPPGAANTPTMTVEDPRCDLIWISGMTGNETSRYIRFEIRMYDWDEWPVVVNYRAIVDKVEVWQDEEAGPWVIEGFTWENWDEDGNHYQRYDDYNGTEWWNITYEPDPPFELTHCYGTTAACGGLGGYQYRGRLSIHFGQDLLGEYAIFPWITFPDYGISCREVAPWTSQNWETDTPGPGGDPILGTDTPIPPTEGPPPPTSSGPEPTQGEPPLPDD